jgi:hypothetical protein
LYKFNIKKVFSNSGSKANKQNLSDKLLNNEKNGENWIERNSP